MITKRELVRREKISKKHHKKVVKELLESFNWKNYVSISNFK